MNLEQKIEAILFYKNGPVEIKKLAQILSINEKEVREYLEKLSISLKSRGIALIWNEKEASLTTSPETESLIGQIAKEEWSRDIGKAGLETLAIILYNGPVSRREIDYIRGVNSTFILRNLSMRGLLDKESDPKDQRVSKYKPSLSLLAHLGIRRIEDLPDFESFKKEIEEKISISNLEQQDE